MSPPSPPFPPATEWRFLKWIFLLVGLILGYGLAKVTTTAKVVAKGDCRNGDSTLVASNVSQQTCQATCPTCIWEQN